MNAKDGVTCQKQISQFNPKCMILKDIVVYAGQNWVVKPVALALNERKPLDIGIQKWEVILSGVAIADALKIKGQANDWLGYTLHMSPELAPAMNEIIRRFGIPVPTDTPYEGVSGAVSASIYPQFQVEYIAPFAALSSIFDQNTAVNAGFSVNNWRPSHYKTLKDPNGVAPILTQIYTGIEIDVAVRDIDAWIYRISYHITLIGKIVFVKSVT